MAGIEFIPSWKKTIKETQDSLLPLPETRKHKVVILYTSAGSGHKAASNALKAAWDELYPEDDVAVQDILENDPQLKHRRAYEYIEHPEIGMHYLPAPPFVLTKTPYEIRRSPLLGEHNEYTLKKILGMSDNEVAELVIEGVVE